MSKRRSFSADARLLGGQAPIVSPVNIALCALASNTALGHLSKGAEGATFLPVLGEVEEIAGPIGQRVQPVSLDRFYESVEPVDAGRFSKRTLLRGPKRNELNNE